MCFIAALRTIGPARIDVPRIENDLGMMLARDGQLQRADELFSSALRRLEEAGSDRLRSYVLLSQAARGKKG